MKNTKTDKCSNCNEPTKRVSGFWDGVDPKTGRKTHGWLFGCNNTDCELRKDANLIEQMTREGKTQTQLTNMENAIDIIQLRLLRISSKCTLQHMAEIAGVSAATYSGWENEREPLPLPIYQLLKAYLEEQ